MKSLRFLLVLIAVTSCRKELPPDVIGEPLFFARGQLEGRAVDLSAGENGYLMDGHHGRDAFGVRTFSGTLRPVACEDCSEMLTVTFRDFRISDPGDPVHIDSVFVPGPYAFQGGAYDPDPNTFVFSARKGGSGPHSYLWDFGDGHTATDSMPVHTYDQSGDHQVYLRITDQHGCTDVSRNQVSTGRDYSPCEIRFEARHLGENRLFFEAKPGFSGTQAGPSLILWSFGDGQSQTGVFGTEHTYQSPGIYEVKLIYIDPQGCFSCDLQNIYSLPQPSCASAIRYRAAPADRQVNTVLLSWTDEDGERYSSLHPDGQPAESYFELLEISPYEADLDGDRTVLVKLRFACRLFSEVDPGKYKDFEEGEAVMAVGLP